VHAVDGVFVGGDRELCGAEALGYCGTAEDAAGTGRVPEGPSVCEDVWADIRDGEELEGVFDGRVMREGGGRFDQGGSGHGRGGS